MNQAEFDAIKTTFPWSYRINGIHGAPGGLIQVIDNMGREVSILAMCEFLNVITRKLTAQPKQQEETA